MCNPHKNPRKYDTHHHNKTLILRMCVFPILYHNRIITSLHKDSLTIHASTELLNGKNYFSYRVKTLFQVS